MNVDRHLNIAEIPDILLVCGHRPSVLSRPTDCWITGWMDGWTEEVIDRFSLREKRERETC